MRLPVLQGCGDLLFHRLGVFQQFSLVTLALVLTLQAVQSILLLRRGGLRGVLAPARFIMALLGVLLLQRLSQRGGAGDGSAPRPTPTQPSGSDGSGVYLAVGLGLGFGVFWMAGAQLRQSLEDLANTDALTGVANRRGFWVPASGGCCAPHAAEKPSPLFCSISIPSRRSTTATVITRVMVCCAVSSNVCGSHREMSTGWAGGGARSLLCCCRARMPQPRRWWPNSPAARSSHSGFQPREGPAEAEVRPVSGRP
jgi:hypothetical protein